MSNSEHLAERLRAHAQLYRHIAETTWREDKAQELVRLAEECTRAADVLTHETNVACCASDDGTGAPRRQRPRAC